MSAREIIAELPKMSAEERQQIRAKIEELEGQNTEEQKKTVWDVLLEFAGTAENLPPDMSVNLDHYLYGGPKQQP